MDKVVDVAEISLDVGEVHRQAIQLPRVRVIDKGVNSRFSEFILLPAIKQHARK